MIEVYIDGRSFNREGCGFSVLLRGERHIWCRGVIPSSNKTTNQLDLIAIKYALLSFRDKDVEAVIYFRNKYIGYIFAREDNDWKKKDIDMNVELIDEVRSLLLQYKNVSLKHDPANPVFNDVLRKTATMVKTKTPYFERS